jgi:hypothetical protein
LQHVVVTINREHFAGDGRAERIAAEGVPVHERAALVAAKAIVDPIGRQRGGKRKHPARESFGGAQKIRRNASMVARPHRAGSAQAGEDLVGDQERVGPFGFLPQPGKETGGVHSHASRALYHRLDDHAGDLVGGFAKERKQAFEDWLPPMVDRVGRPLHVEQKWAKEAGELIDVAGAHRTEGVAMVAAGQREEAVALRAAVLLPILERDFQCDLNRGRAIVAVEDAAEAVRRNANELSSKPRSRLVRRRRERAVHHSFGLPRNGRPKTWMPVPNVVTPPRPTRIENPPPLRRDEPRPLGAIDHQ